MAGGLVLISAASAASAQTYWGYNYGDARQADGTQDAIESVAQ